MKKISHIVYLSIIGALTIIIAITYFSEKYVNVNDELYFLSEDMDIINVDTKEKIGEVNKGTKLRFYPRRDRLYSDEKWNVSFYISQIDPIKDFIKMTDVYTNIDYNNYRYQLIKRGAE